MLAEDAALAQEQAPGGGGVGFVVLVEGGAPGFAEQAGLAVTGEMVFAQSAVAEQAPDLAVEVGAQGFDEVGGERFAAEAGRW